MLQRYHSDQIESRLADRVVFMTGLGGGATGNNEGGHSQTLTLPTRGPVNQNERPKPKAVWAGQSTYSQFSFLSGCVRGRSVEMHLDLFLKTKDAVLHLNLCLQSGDVNSSADVHKLGQTPKSINQSQILIIRRIEIIFARCVWSFYLIFIKFTFCSI